ncbi:MAG: bifunctional UDP-N-acetylglucosamine diphosphorylase/glucosamine-1-phosphate N-acetyltransferase GlmU [Chloroflexi bacterium]|nr:bifunctional UDP-N-acetylglucosamine diphosphorylase/glucosamine-1-phosphate N-acetyltransferase GlmU [Chloroflexota bacterium]
MKSKIPKVLHQICGREMVRLVVDSVAEAGLHPIVVIVPPDSRAIRSALGEDVVYVEQREPLGSGHALLQARPALDTNTRLFVINADLPLLRPESILALTRAHSEREACIALLTSSLAGTDGKGRVQRSPDGGIVGIVEESEADEATLSVPEINVGAYCFDTSWLWENLPDLPPSRNGEVFLTDLIALAGRQGMSVEPVVTEDAGEAVSVNTRVELAEAEGILRQRIRDKWMLNGVSMPDPGAVYIDLGAELGEDTVLYPNTHIRGTSRIGSDCVVGPNSMVIDSVIGDGCKVVASTIEESRLEDRVAVGPYSRVRGGSRLMNDVYLGNFTEIKSSVLGRGTKSSHFSYIGDAVVGSNVNIGAGTVTCNYDGVRKNRTTIGDDAFIGSDSMLVAPINIGARASTGAGSVVTKDVPPDSLAVGVPARLVQKKTGQEEQA